MHKMQSVGAKEMAKFLLGDTVFSDDRRFLAVALEEVAEQERIISNKHCINELMQMNSAHENSINSVTLAITGLSFKCSWQGVSGDRQFYLDEYSKNNPMPRQVFDALVEMYGWGSDAHRKVLIAGRSSRQSLGERKEQHETV